MVIWCRDSGDRLQKSQAAAALQSPYIVSVYDWGQDGRGAAQVGARMALLRVDEVGELERIADEEDRRVVAHQIPVALVGVELHGKAAHVTLGVGRAHLSGHGGKARDQWRDPAHFREDAGTGVARDVLGDGEGAEGAPALGVDDALGDALAVLVGQLLQQVPVLHQHRAARAGGQAVLVVDHRGTGRGGHDGTLQWVVLGHGVFSVEVVGSPTCRDVGKGTSSSMPGGWGTTDCPPHCWRSPMLSGSCCRAT